MFSATDNDKLQQIMTQNPEIKSLISKLHKAHTLEISTISHEIRNPLTLVYSTLQMIESQHPEVLTFRHWDSLQRDIEYMNQLLEELSSYNNGKRLHLTTVDMVSFLKKLALSFASSLADTEIEFTSRISPLLPRASIDSVKIRQALLNLLRNAQDAVNACPDPARRTIRMDADPIHDRMQTLSMIGYRSPSQIMAAESLPKIFPPSSILLSLTRITEQDWDSPLPNVSSMPTKERSTPVQHSEKVLSLRLRFRYNRMPDMNPVSNPPICAILSTPPLENP